MSHSHMTVGFERFEVFVQALRTVGISVLEVPKEGLKQIGQPSVVRNELLHECLCGHGESCPHCRGECDCIRFMRLAHFSTIEGKPMVVEEWLSVHNTDDDGLDTINISVYPEGARPSLVTAVIEDYD